MAKRRYQSRSAKAQDAETGAFLVRKFMIGVFDREDGRAANWGLIAETLFKAGFAALDETAAGPAREAVLRGLLERAYGGLAGQEGKGAPVAASVTPPAVDRGPSLRRDFRP